jgi:hypothetical protein
MYLWRKLTPKQRDELMAFRRLQGLPWHSLAHRTGDKIHYLLTVRRHAEERTSVAGVHALACRGK